jgi:hypothetical protein
MYCMPERADGFRTADNAKCTLGLDEPGWSVGGSVWVQPGQNDLRSRLC